MKTVEYKSLGLVWALSIPETVEEYDTLAKKPGACLEAATDHEVYHGTLGAIRRKFAAAVDAALQKDGITVSWDSGKKDEDGEVVELNEQAWLNKAMVQSGKKITEFAGLQTEVLAAVPFDPSSKPREAATPRKTPEVYTNTAKAWIEANGQPVGNTGKTMDVVKLAEKLAARNPKAQPVTLDDNGLPTVESFARLIHSDKLREIAELKAKQLAEIGSVDLL